MTDLTPLAEIERIVQARSLVLPSLGGQVQIQRQRIESNMLADTTFTSRM